ncbi:hypothetical protein [Methylophaga sp.]|uniref:hypothetical protein n=1 Tax=Methylophaga sp. TaxID=2024840 RepID=UPI003A923AF9
MKRGPKRQFNIYIPKHINQEQLPDNCHWDNSGQGHWYTKYKDPQTGRRKQTRIAGRFDTLPELHQAIADFHAEDQNTFNLLTREFQKSPTFKDLSDNTKRDYRYCSALVENFPTLSGKPLGTVSMSKWSTPMVQKLIDKLASEKGSSAANHALRYTRRLFKWGRARGFIDTNFATGIEQAKEKPKQQLVSDEVYHRVLDHVLQSGRLGNNVKGACPEYLWPVMEIAYLCRLRGIEVIDMTDDRATDEHLVCSRRKGSRTNAVKWSPRLRKAWDAAIARRDKIWSAKKIPVPLNPAERPVFVSKTGQALNKSSLDTAWQRMITLAMEGDDPVITPEERFSLHDLKRKGTTDTKGTRAEKQEAGGWKSADVVDRYDKSVPVVNPVF